MAKLWIVILNAYIFPTPAHLGALRIHPFSSKNSNTLTEVAVWTLTHIKKTGRVYERGWALNIEFKTREKEKNVYIGKARGEYWNSLYH